MHWFSLQTQKSQTRGVKTLTWSWGLRFHSAPQNDVWLHEPPHDKANNVVVHPAKTQISLGIRPVWSESSLSAWRKLGSLATYWVHSEGWAHMPFCWFCHEAAQLYFSFLPLSSFILARSCENVSYAICEQQRHRSVQSDQHLYCSLLR